MTKFYVAVVQTEPYHIPMLKMPHSCKITAVVWGPINQQFVGLHEMYL